MSLGDEPGTTCLQFTKRVYGASLPADSTSKLTAPTVHGKKNDSRVLTLLEAVYEKTIFHLKSRAKL